MAETGADAPEYARLFVEGLKEAGVGVVAALPESLLKTVFRLCAEDNAIRYVQVSNEADMPGICAGTYLAGGRALMIMENSGIRQACEPIARLAFQHAMPLVIAMSYRGEWGRTELVGSQPRPDDDADSGRAAHPLPLRARAGGDQTCHQARLQARRRQQLAGGAGVQRRVRGGSRTMQRIDVFRAIAPMITPEDLVTTSIGGTWDDWWNLKPGVDNTFFTGVLGSVTATALGLAISLPHRRIVAFESDGSMLMNTGIMCTLGAQRPANLTVLVFDNGIYENIGGPPTLTSVNTDLAHMAEGAGCLNCATATETGAVSRCFSQMLDDGEMGFLVAKIVPGKHPWAWRDRKPTDGIEDKYRFLRYVEKLEGVVIHPGAPQN